MRILLFIQLIALMAQQLVGQSMALDPTGKYLVSGNSPVFVQGESPWTLITGLNNTDLETYLSDRASRGFNAVWIAAADNAYQPNPPNDLFGNAPFSGANFSNEQAAYWAHVDYVLQRCAAYGITVWLDPGFVGLNASSGWLNDYANDAASVFVNYGNFLGSRYKNYSNIVWALGGDADPAQTAAYANLAALATALKSSDPNHLITLEACRVCSPANLSSIQALHGVPAWLNINWVYNTEPTVVAGCNAAYSSSPFLPPIMGEDWYELEHSLTTFQARQEGWWEILSGCYGGRIWSNSAINCFNSLNCNGGLPSWQSQLSSGGSVGQQYLGQLMRSREHWKLIPDISHAYLTAGFGSGSTLSVLARTSDGQTMIAYFSDGNATNKTINMAGIVSGGSTVHGWWFNPQTAATMDLGTFANSGTRTFMAPDGNDWVLVLDDNSASLPPPGMKLVAPIGLQVTVD